ncbi:MAG TPA: MmgE/PrpD family protein [Spirochaetota bacterium]|nr:MmgE/PrpD family protein [Spirochaetota bacterium]HQP48108.1 MmgE/PrpD family protein [Spirochaetota bacterium]
MDYTRKLAEFCSGVAYGSLPENIILKSKQCLLDFIANVYGSLELEPVQRIAERIKSLKNAPNSTVLGFGFRTDIQNAAFINGTLAEAIEGQDGLRFGGNHSGTAVIPAALAAAESAGKSGRDVIAAIVAGYETANRISASMHPHHTLSGFLPTGTCGTFGAAAAAGNVFGYDAACMVNAFGNAGYLVPLSMAEQLMGGYTIKMVQGGQAASAGIMAAWLAESGITGIPVVLEGSELQGGFTQITTCRTGGTPVWERITDGLGEVFSIEDVYFKPYTACRHTHGAAQAVLELGKEKKIRPDDVDHINVYTYGIAKIAVGKEFPAGGSIVSAQFSIPFVVAVCMIDGDLGPLQLTEKRLSDPAVVNLSKKIDVHSDDDLNKMYPDKTASRVEITLRGGEVLTRQIDIPVGDPRDPMGNDALTEKTLRFAVNRDRKAVMKIVDMVLNLEKLTDMRELMESV